MIVQLARALLVPTVAVSLTVSSLSAASAAIVEAPASAPASTTTYPAPVLDDQPGAQSDKFTFPVSAEYDFKTPHTGFVVEGQAYTTYGAATVPYQVYQEGLQVHADQMAFDTTPSPDPDPEPEPEPEHPVGPNTAVVKSDGHNPNDSDTRAYVVFQNNSGATIYGIDARAVNSRGDTIFPDGYYTEPILHGKYVQIKWFANALPAGRWTFSVQPNYDPKQNMEAGVLDTREPSTTEPRSVNKPKAVAKAKNRFAKGVVINRKVETRTRVIMIFRSGAGPKNKEVKSFVVASGQKAVRRVRCINHKRPRRVKVIATPRGGGPSARDTAFKVRRARC